MNIGALPADVVSSDPSPLDHVLRGLTGRKSIDGFVSRYLTPVSTHSRSSVMSNAESATVTIHERRIALVTGANKGIGREISRQLATKGILVLAAARDQQRGEKAVAALASAAKKIQAGSHRQHDKWQRIVCF